MPDATYDSTDGLFKEDPKPDYQPKHWEGNPNVPSGHGSYTNHDPLTKPKVPGSSDVGRQSVSVHTPSMDQFADNIETLIPYVTRAQGVVEKVSVHPGSFYHANVLREKVSGNDGTGGLKGAFDQVLTDLANGLTDLCSGMRQMSQKYQTTEDANKMSAKDLDDYMASASPELGAVGQDASVQL